MSQYTFDESKIRRNAKRASSASFFLSVTKSKWLPLTSAAAVFAVVAAVIFGAVLNDNGITPPAPHIPYSNSGNASTVNERDRLIIMATNNDFIDENGLADEQIEMYISFAKPMTSDELDSVLASYGEDVQVVVLWHNDLMVESAEEHSAAFFNGARVLANGGLYSELTALPAFTVIELGGGVIDDSNFVPITTIPTHDNPIDLPWTYNNPSFDPLNIDGTGEPEDPFVLPPDGEVDIDDSNPEPVFIEPIVIPGDDGLIELDIAGAADARFINGNRFVLTTANQVLLYEIITGADDVHSLTALAGFMAVNPQVVYVDANTGTLLITGGDAFGRVTNLFIAEGESGELRQLDTTVIAQAQAEIRTALFKDGEVVLRTRSDSINTIYTAGRNGGFILSKAEETEDILVILGFTTQGFKYARISEGVTRTFKYNTVGFNGEEIDLGFAELSAMQGELRFMRSNDGSNFAVITDNGTFIWNASLGALTDYAIDTLDVRFHRHSSSIISDDKGNWYILQGAELIPTTEEEADALAKKPVFSSAYRFYEIAPTSVKISIIS